MSVVAKRIVAEEVVPAKLARGRRKSTAAAPPDVREMGALAKEDARDLEIINRNARGLNREARDVLAFQGPV